MFTSTHCAVAAKVDRLLRLAPITEADLLAIDREPQFRRRAGRTAVSDADALAIDRYGKLAKKMSTLYRPIPDFLTLPDVFVGEIELRRNDLADLRLHVRHPEGIERGRCLSKQSRNRLIAHGMLGLGEDSDGNVRTFATDYGIAVARANASCIDGSEGLPPTRPGPARDPARS
jgi:hypothetical protein